MDSQKKLLIILILAVLLRSLSFSDAHLLGDSDPYYHVRIAKSLPDYDEKSFFGREHTYPPFFHLLLAGFNFFIKDWFLTASLLPVLLGALGVVSVYFLGKELYNEEIGILSALFLAVNPLHLQRSMYLRPDVLVLLLIVLVVLFVFRALKNKRYVLPSVLALSLYSLSHYTAVYGFFTVCLVAFYLEYNRKDIRVPALILLLSGAIALVCWGPLILKFGLPLYSEIYATSAEQNLPIVTLIPLLVLFFAGAYISRGFLGVWALGSLLLLASPRAVIYLTIPFVLLLAVVFERHIFRITRWKSACLGIVVLAFGFVSLQFSLGFDQAFDREYTCLYYIKENLVDEKIANSWNSGHYVTYFGGKALEDGYFEYAPGINERFSDFERVISTGNPSPLEKYGAGYLLITERDCQHAGACFNNWGNVLVSNEDCVLVEL